MYLPHYCENCTACSKNIARYMCSIKALPVISSLLACSASCEICKLERCAGTSGQAVHAISKRQLRNDLINTFGATFGQIFTCVFQCNLLFNPGSLITTSCVVGCFGTLLANLASGILLAVGISQLTG